MKTHLYMTVSIDGFIALENNDAPWSREDLNNFQAFVKEKKNLIIGRRTYDLMKSGGELKVFEEELTVVVTSGSIDYQDDHTIAVHSPEEALTELQKRGLEEAVVCGGGELNASFMKRGLIDEMIINIEPMVFGKGKKLFGDKGLDSIKSLEFIEAKELGGGSLQVKYRLKK